MAIKMATAMMVMASRLVKSAASLEAGLIARDQPWHGV
ncbi:MAG: hypothetical protein ACI8W7_003491 [Gammaproteobacteria bacterium]